MATNALRRLSLRVLCSVRPLFGRNGEAQGRCKHGRGRIERHGLLSMSLAHALLKFDHEPHQERWPHDRQKTD
jgi:hypothetical protein